MRVDFEIDQPSFFSKYRCIVNKVVGLVLKYMARFRKKQNMHAVAVTKALL